MVSSAEPSNSSLSSTTSKPSGTSTGGAGGGGGRNGGGLDAVGACEGAALCGDCTGAPVAGALVEGALGGGLRGDRCGGGDGVCVPLPLLLLWFVTCVASTATKVATDATSSTPATHTAAFILGLKGGGLGVRDAARPASTSPRGLSGVSAAAGALTEIVARGRGGLMPLGGAIRTPASQQLATTVTAEDLILLRS